MCTVVVEISNSAKDFIEKEVSAFYQSPDNSLYMLPATPQVCTNAIAFMKDYFNKVLPLSLSLSLTHTHTHTKMNISLSLSIYIYIYIFTRSLLPLLVPFIFLNDNKELDFVPNVLGSHILFLLIFSLIEFVTGTFGVHGCKWIHWT